MAEEFSFSQKRIEELFDRVRRAEIQNDKTGSNDDKSMVNKITNYLLHEAKKELEDEANEV